MQKCCIILASSDDRMHLLKKCVECLKKSRYKDTDTYLFFQGNEDCISEEYRSFFKGILWDKKLRGVFTPRYELMKKFCLEYEFTILIDDDLFMNESTSYERCMRFCEFQKRAGAVALTHSKENVKNQIRCVSGTSEYFNVCGGLVFPRESIKTIIEYFKDKERDYTEDVVWLLLYVKGYDLYKDYSSYASHKANRKSENGNFTGYNKMRIEKPHVPMLSEWFHESTEMLNGTKVWKLKEMTDINEKGIEERRKNYDSKQI